MIRKYILHIIILIFISIVVIFRNDILFLYEQLMTKKSAHKTCLNSNCFELPKGWVDLNYVYGNKDSYMKNNESLRLKNASNIPINVYTIYKDIDIKKLAKNVEIKNFKHCTYYEVYDKLASSQILTIDIINYNMQIILPHDLNVKNEILNAICLSPPKLQNFEK